MKRPQAAAVCFLLGLALVFVIDAPVARIIGVPLMLLGIGLGIVAIASPEFLAGDRDPR
jgi:disulfide bond formation protein DsbB